MPAKKRSQKDKPSNARYKLEMRWIRNKERRQKQHKKRLERKDDHMERRARARKKTPADIRWAARPDSA